MDRLVRGGRRAFGVVLALLVAGLGMAALSMPVRADEVFQVTVPVDVTAETAAGARESALAEGQAQAFRQLEQRMTLIQDWGRLPAPNRESLAFLVQDLSVANEKTSSVRYLADLSVRFKADAVRQLLRNAGIPFAETQSKPVVVLPIYQAAGAVLMFDDPNPWRDAWRRVIAGVNGLVPMVLPLGDLADIAVIGPEPALKGDATALSAIARRYDVTDVLVVQAVQSIAPDRGRPVLEVLATRFGTASQEQSIMQAYEQRPDEELADLLGRAAGDVALRVQDQWKRDLLLQFDEVAVVPVRIPVASLRDWQQVRQRLSRTPAVQRIELVLLSKAEVRVNIHYVGGLEQLVLALRQSDLILAGEGGDNVLSLASAQAPAQP